MTLDTKRLEVLRKVENGEITPDEASRFLEELEDDELAISEISRMESSPEPITDVISIPVEEARSEVSPIEQKRIEYWKRWWLLPFAIGVIIMLLGAYAMYSGYQAAGLSWGFWLSWLPFGLGVVIIALSAASRRSRWIHVRVRQKPGEKPGQIAISFPLALAVGLFNIANRFGVAKGADKTVNEAFDMINSAVTSEEPIHIQVNDEDGEQVEVYIG